MFDEFTAKKHESIGVILLLVALLVFLCLVSYSSGDTSFNTLSPKPTAENKIGRLGAYTSDLLYQTFGFSAFLLLVPLLVIGWKLISGRKIHAKYLKTCGFLLLLSASAAAFQLFPFGPENPAFMPGGVTGLILSDFLLKNLNRVGTIIVIGGALFLGILATTPWSLSRSFSRSSTIPDPDPPTPSLKERFLLWREKRKARRIAKVNIKPATTVTLNLPPKSIPVRPHFSSGSITPVSKEARDESNTTHVFDETTKPRSGRRRNFKLPPIELLNAGEDSLPVDETELVERAKMLADKCAEFDANGNITQIHPGPVVTTFEFKPDPGVKYSRITGLVDDLCLGIKAESLRIDRIPGKATIGIEVPNPNRETIMLRDLVESDAFTGSRSKLTLAMGKLINGSPCVADLSKMPHLLIAGSTGAGKSVGLNCMITSILYKATPEEVRFIFIDPKCVELGIYTDIPHLLTPIVTDPGEAANALRWATNEMEIRYKKLARQGVRNIEQYNALLRSEQTRSDKEDEDPEEPLPYLVLVIDELADLMMVSSKEVEASISRLTAKARAVGIHLILATQRPSVDVITGVIKSNLPSRVAFKVASKVDSRTIIDGNGAEQLLGNGDMLFIPPGTARLIRVHGAYLSEKETKDIVEYLKAQGRPTYDDSVLNYGAEAADEPGGLVETDATDSMYNDAVRVVVGEGRASTSLLQRRLSIGYGRAAKLIDMMYNNGIVGPADGAKPREVLAGLDFLERLDE
ncbi:MAG: DNA translocase FtsK [Acidobacteria bacterium]|nr:DNA translocase FtsK [Acidobacteriota bacterium]